MKQPLLGTGLSGLVGSKFVEMFSDSYEFENLDLSNGVDITDEDAVKQAVEHSSASHVIHFAAYTNVSEAHKQNGDKSGIVYTVNVEGTQNIANATKEFGKHLIHISTAYVFDGEKEGLYSETDPINPIEWYGQTKAWAEEEVEKSGVDYTILRIDQPYRQDEFPKADILHRIIRDLKANSLPPMFTDHTFTPTKIETFAQNLHTIIQQDISGLYHATTEPITTDYDFATKIKNEFNLAGEIRKGSLAEFIKTVDRPYQKNTALSVEKLQKAL